MDSARRYLHPFLDSARWSLYRPRNGDIIIATPFKSGTTWMQMIVLGLLHGIDNPPLLKDVDHWIDFRLTPESDMLNRLEEQNCRRFIKTHLPFDAIPYYQNVKYIVVDRDPKDVFMSLWNHYRNMDVDRINSSLPAEIKPIPPCSENINEFLETWLTKGYFEWETEGYPFWSNLRHVQSWFDVRNLENITHFHYNNLLSDSASEIRKLSIFLDVNVCDEQIEALAEYTSFTNIKKNLNNLFPGSYGLFKNGADTFFYKGMNGRWKNEFAGGSDELFHSVASSIISTNCSKWLQSGIRAD